MGLLLLLGMLLSQTGGFLALSPEQPNNCITAESFCVADPVCNDTYRILENCSKSNLLSLGHEARDRCLRAELDIKNYNFQGCKCHRRTRKQEEQCLRIYWTVHSTLTQGDFRFEASPYEDIENEEESMSKYNKLATLASGTSELWRDNGDILNGPNILKPDIAGDNPNPCLHSVHVCSLDNKCTRLRSSYASTCTVGHRCDRRKCHRGLRQFFERVSMDFTKRLLFCPCQDDFCGERRRKTIAPACSFQSSTQPNCLFLLDMCLRDSVCKSRLVDFQERCRPSGTSSNGCFQSNHAACLEAYMGMIGTSMTPNYFSNSSVEVTLWCSCEKSGNRKEDCDEILNSFANNKCLRNAIQSQMNLDQVNTDYGEELQFTPSINIQGDGTSTVLTAKMVWEHAEKIKPGVLMPNGIPFPNSVYSGNQFSSLTPTLTFFVLLLVLL